MTTLELLSEHACFDGTQRFYRHDSQVIGLPMRFSIYLPPSTCHASHALQAPALFYLAGLTCTDETFPTKAGAQRAAAQAGIVLVSPDTSPRGANIPGESDAWDFGVGAGFYVDATQAPWNRYYRMYSYLLELHELVLREFPVDTQRVGIFGHSMGGHGALVLGLRNPDRFRSISAFAPIAAPGRCPWGRKAFTGYLGSDESDWQAYDASALVAGLAQPLLHEILIDQGLADKFLAEQLYPDVFEQACMQAGQPLRLCRHEGYDHGYYFISTFMQDHIAFHARLLGA